MDNGNIARTAKPLPTKSVHLKQLRVVWNKFLIFILFKIISNRLKKPLSGLAFREFFAFTVFVFVIGFVIDSSLT